MMLYIKFLKKGGSSIVTSTVLGLSRPYPVLAIIYTTTMFAVIVLFCIVPELFDKDVCNGMCVFFEIQVK